MEADRDYYTVEEEKRRAAAMRRYPMECAALAALRAWHEIDAKLIAARNGARTEAWGLDEQRERAVEALRAAAAALAKEEQG